MCVCINSQHIVLLDKIGKKKKKKNTSDEDDDRDNIIIANRVVVNVLCVISLRVVGVCLCAAV